MIKKFAFTINELMIAAVVVGIIASITVPSIFANYNQKAWDTKTNIFAGHLHDALKEMRINKALKGQETTENFVSNFSSYTKLDKICDTNALENCFAEKFIWDDETVSVKNISSANDLGKTSWGTNVLGIKFGNGVSALLAYNPNCANDIKLIRNSNGDNQLQTDCLAIIFDVSEFNRPNQFGKDIRTFNAEH